MIPFFPAGATLSSVLAAVSELSGGRAQRYAPRLGAYKAFLGLPSARVARDYLAGQVTPTELVRMCSCAQLWCSILSPAQADRLQAQLSDGSADQLRVIGLVAAPRMARLTRRCRSCVSDDTEIFGYAYARVIHQLPAMRHCLTHGRPLEECCAECGAPFRDVAKRGMRWNIHHCLACGCASGTPLRIDRSRGYTDLSVLISRMLNGEDVGIDPQRRVRLMHQAFAAFDGRSDLLMSRFSKYWAADSLEDACTKASVQSKALRRLFEQEIQPCTFDSVVVSLCFASTFPSAGTGYHGCALDTRHLRQNAQCSRSASLAERLRSHVEDMGLSASVAVRLSTGTSLGRLTALGHSGYQLRTLLAHLPRRERLQVEAMQRERRLYRKQPRKTEMHEFAEHFSVARQRARAIKRIRSGLRTRTELWRDDGALVRWLIKHDQAWIDARLPAFQGRWPKLSEQRARVKEIVQEKQSDKNLRKLIAATHQRLYCWMLEHDANWFNALVPGAHFSWRSCRSESEEFRQAILRHRARTITFLRRKVADRRRQRGAPDDAAITRQADALRSMLSTQAAALYRFMTTHDASWLDRILPRA